MLGIPDSAIVNHMLRSSHNAAELTLKNSLVYAFVAASLLAASLIGFAARASEGSGSGVSGNGEVELVEMEDLDDETKIEGNFDGDQFDFKIETKFEKNKTDVHVLAAKLLKRLQLSKTEVAAALEVKDAGELDDDVVMTAIEDSELEAKIDVDADEGMSEVEAKFEISGMAGSKDAAVKAISDKLSALTVHDIHSALELDMN